MWSTRTGGVSYTRTDGNRRPRRRTRTRRSWRRCRASERARLHKSGLAHQVANGREVEIITKRQRRHSQQRDDDADDARSDTYISSVISHNRSVRYWPRHTYIAYIAHMSQLAIFVF